MHDQLSDFLEAEVKMMCEFMLQTTNEKSLLYISFFKYLLKIGNSEIGL